ncbi:MAG: hypothetical protein A2293_08355 [Elusimicrobia bacterium RIFOXYB2_FULL_49_7]|nr:MAG: hypothetical protein A2293_08355 [Elusimicrobia bacterium RIFOXYB2_FULL_49_7]
MKTKKTVSPPIGPINSYVTNRLYNLRMRDIYYSEVETQFTSFNTALQSDPLSPDFVCLYNACDAVDTAYRYAKQAIFGLSPQKVRHAAEGLEQDATLPFLQEEFLFIHLLEELHSSCRYLINRFVTIKSFLQYRTYIDSLPKNKETRNGFITKILSFVEENRKAEENEIKHLADLAMKRIQLANRIFAIVRSMENLQKDAL